MEGYRGNRYSQEAGSPHAVNGAVSAADDEQICA